MTDKISDNTGGGWGGDAYPMETAEAEQSRGDLARDYMMEPWAPPTTYKWALNGTHISVGEDSHDVHFAIMGTNDWDGPHAWGTVEVSHRWDNLWHVDGGNLSLGMIDKRIRRYAKEQGWGQVTITDKSGVPMESTKMSAVVPQGYEIKPMGDTGYFEHERGQWKPRYYEVKDKASGQMVQADRMQTRHGTGDGVVAYYNGEPVGSLTWQQEPHATMIGSAWVHPDHRERGLFSAMYDQMPQDKPIDAYHWDNPMLRQKVRDRQRTASQEGTPEGDFPTGDWHHDDLYGEYSGADSYALGDHVDDEVPGGMPMVCSECAEPFANYHQWLQHVRQEHINPDRKPGQGPVSVTDMDDPDNYMPGDSGTAPGTKQYDTGERAFMYGSMMEAKRTISAQEPVIPGPLPFIYDIDADKIALGSPGQRHSDIHGQFTPGGIVEGLYLPDGKLQYRTDTDMPYTVRHMVQLWQAITGTKQTPKGSEWNLPVKHVFKLDNGKPYKIAGKADHSVAPLVKKLALADDAVNNVVHAVGTRGNVYVVGGAVRDVVLGRVPKDVDLMVQGIPMDDLQSLLSTLPGRVDLTGKAFGVLRYKSPDGSEVEVALPRREQSKMQSLMQDAIDRMPEKDRKWFEAQTPEQQAANFQDLMTWDKSPIEGLGHKDFDVQHDPYMHVEDDLQRRDFTGNAMAVNLNTGELHDPYGGAADLRQGKLRTVSPEAFRDDPLRTVRALASASRHGLEPDEKTRQQMAQYAPRLTALPAERIQAELDKIMSGDDPERAIRTARDTGVLHYILPEFTPTLGFDQRNKYHRLPLDEHLLEVLKRTAELDKDKDVRMAALMHDVGKPASYWEDPEGNGHYYRNSLGMGADHQDVGADITEAALNRLAYPKARINRITHLVRHHMFAPFDSLKAARRRINQVGADHIQDLLTLRAADQQGKGADEYENKVPVEYQRQLAQQVMQEGQPTGVSSLAINGNDLKMMGLTPGPQFKTILEGLADKVIDDPSLNTRGTLLDMARGMSGGEHVASERKTANILDPVRPGLDPAVFDDAASPYPKLRSAIAHWVKQHLYKVMVDNGWPEPAEYLTMVLTGSLTTYQYSPESDFDVSLWIDVEHFPEFHRAQLIKLMIAHMDGTMVPGTTHPIQCFVVDPRKFTKDDLYRVGLRSGWDIDKKQWIVPPDKTRVHDVAQEFPTYLAHAKMVLDKFLLMLRYYPPMVTKLWHDLHGQRMRDMGNGLGDFSESNIAYKMLANYPGLHAAIERATGLHLASPQRGLGGHRSPTRWADVLEYPEIGLYRKLVPGEPLPPVNFTVFARLQLQASWSDVSAKAKRLMQSGQVEVVRNTPNFVIANVEGDHGNYQVEISRHDPASQVIEQWSCTCPWNQFAWGRTRGWKKLEGRVCSHALATYWQSRSTPLDLENEDQGFQIPRGQKAGPAGPGQMKLPGMTPDDLAAQQQQEAEQGVGGPEIQQSQEAELQQQGEPGAPDVTSPADMVAPGPTDMSMPSLPQTPKTKRNPADRLKNQLNLWDVSMPIPGVNPPVPPINPVSIPGGKPASPTDPLNQLGTPGINTFSRTSNTEFDWHYAKDQVEQWAQELLARGKSPRVTVTAPDVHLEARGGKVPMPGAVPISSSGQGIPLYRIADLGYDPVTRRHMNSDEFGPHGPGAPEDRGTFHPVPAGSAAEVVRVYPEIKSMFVRVPLTYQRPYDGGLHPHHLEGFVEYGDVSPGRTQRDPFREPPRMGGWAEDSGWIEATA